MSATESEIVRIFLLDEILKWDTRISSAMALPSLTICGCLDLRLVFLIMEWSVHGIPWLVGAIIATFIAFRHNWSYESQRKMAILGFGIVLDLAFVGLIKIIVQRSRPPYNQDDQVYEAPIADRFSFPSGHSARAAMLSVLAINLCENINPLLMYPLAVIFPILLGASRVIMGRHFVTDVLSGFLLGIIEAIIALQLPDAIVKFCVNLLNNILDAIGL